MVPIPRKKLRDFADSVTVTSSFLVALIEVTFANGPLYAKIGPFWNWVNEYTTSLAVILDPSENLREESIVNFQTLPFGETDHDFATAGEGLSWASKETSGS
jgi:hypothetical protein